MNVGQPVVERRDVIVVNDVIRDVIELVLARGLVVVVVASFDVAAMSVRIVINSVA